MKNQPGTMKNHNNQATAIPALQALSAVGWFWPRDNYDDADAHVNANDADQQIEIEIVLDQPELPASHGTICKSTFGSNSAGGEEIEIKYSKISFGNCISAKESCIGVTSIIKKG